MKLKWFKLATDLFDNFKMKYISSLENGKVIMLIWVKLLCLAAKKNDGGAIYIVRNKLTTAKELSILLDESADTLTEAIGIFSELDMIRFDGIGNIVIKNFDEFQWGEGEDEAEDAEENIIEDEAQRKKELARQRKLRWKQKQKAEQINNENDSVPPAFPERSGSVPPAFHERSTSVPPAFHERSNSVPERSPINYNIRGEEIREENNRIDYILSEERRDICSLRERDMPMGVGGEAYGVGSQSAAEGNLYHERSASIPPPPPKTKEEEYIKTFLFPIRNIPGLKASIPSP